MTCKNNHSGNLEFLRGQYEKLLQEFLSGLQKLEMPENVLGWIKNMSDYNTLGGKMNRGMCILESGKILSSDLSPKHLDQLSAIAWAIEWLQASFLIGDDIMDAGILRRGKPCWYRNKHVGMIAINDCFVLHSIIYSTIRCHFQENPQVYMELVELFNDVKMKTEVGQLLDLLTAPPSHVGRRSFDDFTKDTYRKIVIFKTAYYSFYLPIMAAITISQTRYPIKTLEKVKETLLAMGEYFQIQDDYLDCFGDPELIGKIGTDIQEGKCSWLIVTAMGLPNLSPAEREIIMENYGKDNSVSVEAIKKIYHQLQLPRIFEELEEEYEKQICSEISEIKMEVPPLAEVLEMLLKKIVRRQK